MGFVRILTIPGFVLTLRPINRWLFAEWGKTALGWYSLTGLIHSAHHPSAPGHRNGNLPLQTPTVARLLSLAASAPGLQTQRREESCGPCLYCRSRGSESTPG